MAHDLFVSYAKADRAWVEGYLLDALERAGVRYHSEDAFALGVPRLLEFERAVQDSQRTLLIFSPAYLADSFSQFVDLLGQTFGLETATWPVIPLILHPVKLPPRLSMLEALDGADPATWPAVLDRLCAALQRPVPAPPPPPDCPYPGMLPFREADSDRFFGRDQEIDDMVGCLRAHPVLAVIGPSGSGKSSLVLAGLLPALRKSGLFGAGEWNIRVMRPGEAPLEMLAHTLEDVPRSRQLGASGGAAPASDPELADGARLLLVVDQFEESFTLAGAQSLPFQRELLRLSQATGCYVVMTVRADFYPDLMNAPIWRSIQAHRLEIAPLEEVGLKAAIMRPAEDTGVFVESALVERLLADGAGEPGILPLIQETLVLLWERLERRFLPLRAYDALVVTRGAYGTTGAGGLTGLQVAMARRADAALAELAPEQQEIARRIFLRLIAFGEGRADTRRQQPVAALRSSARATPELFDATLCHLTDARLLTLSGEEHDADRKVDIAHEALIAGWPTLHGWLNERRESEQVRRRLDDKAAEWVRLGCGEGGLLDEIELAEAQRWLDSPAAEDMGFDAALPELVVFSRAAIEQVEYAQELARQRELAQAQALAEEQQRRAEEQTRSAGRLRRLVAVLAGVLLLAITSAAFAYTQKLLAAENEATAQSNANSAATNAADAFRNANTAVSEKGRADKNLQLANLNAAAQATAKAQALTNADRADGNAATAQANAATAVAANALAQTNYQLANSRLVQAQTARAEADQNASEAQLRAAAEATAKADALTSFQEAQTAAAAEVIAKGNAQTAAAAEVIAKGNAQTNANMAQTSAAIAQANEQTAVAAKGQAQANFELAASRLAQAQTAEARANANAAAAQQAQAQAQLSAQQAQAAAAAEKAAKNEAENQARTAVAAKNDALSQQLIAQTAEANAQNQAVIAQTAAAGEAAAKVDAQHQAATAVAAQATAVAESNRANQQATIALSRQLAAQSLYYQNQQLDLALLLGMEANQRSNTFESRNALLSALEHNPYLITRLNNQPDGFQRTALRADGKTLVSVSGAGQIGVWDYSVRPLQETRLGELPRWTGVLALSRDGSRLAAFGCVALSAPTQCQQNGLVLMDLTTNPLVSTTLDLTTSYPSSLVFSPDGRQLAVGSAGTIQIWDLASVPPQRTKQIQSAGNIRNMIFSPNGLSLVVGSYESTIIRWNLSASTPVSTTLADMAAWPVSAAQLAFSADGMLLAINRCTSAYDNDGALACTQHDVVLWDLSVGAGVMTALANTAGTDVSFDFSPSGRQLAIGRCLRSGIGTCEQGDIRVWDVAAQPPVETTLTDDTQAVSAVTFNMGGTLVAALAANGVIELSSATTHQITGTPLQVGTLEVSSTAFSPDGTKLAAGYCVHQSMPDFQLECDQGQVMLWNLSAGSPSAQVLPGTLSAAPRVAFSPDRRWLAAAAGYAHTLWLWDLSTPSSSGTVLTGAASVSTFAFNPDGTLLEVASGDGVIMLWDIRAQPPTSTTLSGITTPGDQLAFSADGRHLAGVRCAGYNDYYGCNQREIMIWDMSASPPARTTLGSFPGSVYVLSLALSRDGTRLAVARSDEKIQIWNSATSPGALLGELITPRHSAVQSMSFSPDGTILSTGYAPKEYSDPPDPTIRLWDIAMLLPLGEPLTGHTNSVLSVDFNAQGTQLASGSVDGTIRLSDIDVGSWEQRACGIVGHNLTQREWAQFFGAEQYRKTCPNLP